MQRHAELAREVGAEAHVIEDGDVLRLSGNRPEVVESVPTGRMVVDGDRLLPLEGGVLAARRRMLFNGVVVASLAVDGEGRVRGEPQVSAPGLFEQLDEAPSQIASELSRALADLPAHTRREEDKLRDAARTALRRALGRRMRKRPMVDIHLLRV